MEKGDADRYRERAEEARAMADEYRSKYPHLGKEMTEIANRWEEMAKHVEEREAWDAQRSAQLHNK